MQPVLKAMTADIVNRELVPALDLLAEACKATIAQQSELASRHISVKLQPILKATDEIREKARAHINSLPPGASSSIPRAP